MVEQSGEMDAQMLNALGLTRNPFDDSSVAGLFYPGAGRQEIVDQLQHLLRFTDNVLLLAGLEGSGRTTIRDYLVHHIEQDVSLCAMDAQLLGGPERLLEEILSGFGHPAGGNHVLLQQHCREQQSQGRLCWLLIDEAQHLSEQDIRMLAGLRGICGTALHIALFGPASLEELLQRRLPDDVQVYTLQFSNLDGAEVRTYIDYRLRIAGGRGNNPLSEAQCQQLAQQSRGNLNRLHALAAGQLTETVRVSQTPLAGLPRSHLILVALMAVAVASLYLFNYDEAVDSSEQSLPRISVDRQRVEVLAATPPVAEAPVAGKDGQLGSAPGPTPEQPIQTEVDSALNAKEPPPGNGSERQVPVVVTENVDAASPDTESTSPVRPAALTDTRAATNTGSTAKPERFVYGADGRRGGTSDDDETQLLALPSSAWTVQLMGSHDAAAIKSFRQQFGLDTHRYRKLRNSKDWFVVVYGDYVSREAAQAAVRGLPARLQRIQPWVRPLADVQREIREARALP